MTCPTRAPATAASAVRGCDMDAIYTAIVSFIIVGVVVALARDIRQFRFDIPSAAQFDRIKEVHRRVIANHAQSTRKQRPATRQYAVLAAMELRKLPGGRPEIISMLETEDNYGDGVALDTNLCKAVANLWAPGEGRSWAAQPYWPTGGNHE